MACVGRMGGRTVRRADHRRPAGDRRDWHLLLRRGCDSLIGAQRGRLGNDRAVQTRRLGSRPTSPATPAPTTTPGISAFLTTISIRRGHSPTLRTANWGCGAWRPSMTATRTPQPSSARLAMRSAPSAAKSRPSPPNSERRRGHGGCPRRNCGCRSRRHLLFSAL